MKNLKIGAKFILVFGITIALLVAVAVVSLVSLRSASGSLDNFYNQPFPNTRVALEMKISLEQAAKNLGYATMSESTEDTKKYLDEMQASLGTVKDALAFLKENYSGDKAVLTDFEDTMNSGVEAKEAIIQYAGEGENAKAIQIFFDEYMAVLEKADALLTEVGTVANARADTVYNDANASNTSSMIALIAIVAVTLLATVFLAVYLTKSLTAPILEMDKVAKQMVGGKLDVKIDYTAKDELGDLSESMRMLTTNIRDIIADLSYALGEIGGGNFTCESRNESMYVNDFEPLKMSMFQIMVQLSETLNEINQASEQVAVGADQVSVGAQSLSQGATEQAASVEELSATVTSISEQVKATAENAQQANSLSIKSAQFLEVGSRQMEETTKAMSDISATSSEIGKIIKTIDDIAFQTNILALNAAVEAARAGAAGKGFAVVADEVRSLAQKSAEAAKNTTYLIESSVNAVADGIKIVDQTAGSLHDVVENTKLVTAAVAQIAEASEVQAESVVQVLSGVEQISSVVQVNAATAEESAAASEELSGQAQMLKTSVSKFTLRSV